TATITITLRPLNDTPVATNISFTIAVDTTCTVTLPCTYLDSKILTYSVVTALSAALVTESISGNNATFTPKPNWNGYISFTYRANDGELNSYIATATITVTPVNDAPSVANLTHSMDEDTTATITLPVTDVDLQFEGDSHTWSIVTAPNSEHGTATI